MSEYLFVYGSLLPGHVPAEASEIVNRLSWVDSAHVKGKLYDFGDYCGALLHEASGTKVSGGVYELPGRDRILAALDAYEGFDTVSVKDSLFRRERVKASLSDGREVECWVYVYNRNPGAACLIESGDYAGSKVGRGDSTIKP